MRKGPYGDLAYCTFRLPDSVGRDVKGLYAYAVNSDLKYKYVGRCRDAFHIRVRRGYVRTAPRNCYRDGQSTNCHLNALINQPRADMTFHMLPTVTITW